MRVFVGFGVRTFFSPQDQLNSLDKDMIEERHKMEATRDSLSKDIWNNDLAKKKTSAGIVYK